MLLSKDQIVVPTLAIVTTPGGATSRPVRGERESLAFAAPPPPALAIIRGVMRKGIVRASGMVVNAASGTRALIGIVPEGESLAFVAPPPVVLCHKYLPLVSCNPHAAVAY